MKSRHKPTGGPEYESTASTRPEMTAAEVQSFWHGDHGHPVPPRPTAPSDETTALERLGALPFPRGGFPLLGFLASVYDHVRESVKAR